jgi:hypothetical protein
LTNATVTGNSGDGVIAGDDRFVVVIKTTVSGDKGVKVEFAPGEVFAGDFNLFGHRSLINARAFDHFTPEPTDITANSNGNRPTRFRVILKTVLANNGGPTRTHGGAFV